MSANTGRPPASTTAEAEAMNEKAGTTTSSPGRRPHARSKRTSASVPLFTPTTCFAPVYAASAASNSTTLWPCEYFPRSSTSIMCLLVVGHNSENDADWVNSGTVNCSPPLSELSSDTNSGPSGDRQCELSSLFLVNYEKAVLTSIAGTGKSPLVRIGWPFGDPGDIQSTMDGDRWCGHFWWGWDEPARSCTSRCSRALVPPRRGCSATSRSWAATRGGHRPGDRD